VVDCDHGLGAGAEFVRVVREKRAVVVVSKLGTGWGVWRRGEGEEGVVVWQNGGGGRGHEALWMRFRETLNN
jgi:hypothetical protein